MPKHEAEPRWRSRLVEMGCANRKIAFPDAQQTLDQDAEWCDVIEDRDRRRVRLHDYDAIFAAPGLYEQIIYERLECQSPERVAGLLEDVLSVDYNESLDSLRVLDLGAGNGMVGDELSARGVETLIGADIIPEARDATLRDRPGVYDDYVVADFGDLPEPVEKKLRKTKLNCLTTVAALGFGDIPANVFLKALDLIESPGWVAFNIKERFFSERDATGFSLLIRQLEQRNVIRTEAFRRYRHRLSITGKPLYYLAMVARKLTDTPDEIMAEHGA